MQYMTRVGLLFSVGTFLVGAVASAAPVHLAYQGRLVDSTGVPENGSANLAIGLWDVETGGADAVWSDTWTGHALEAGYFSVVLGSGDALDSSTFSTPLWVEVVVDGQAMSPRQPLYDVPYAAGGDLSGALTASGSDVAVSGTLTLGYSDPATCAGGEVRWEAAYDRAEICIGGAWRIISTTEIVPVSCADALRRDPSLLNQDGLYTIDPDEDGSAPQQEVICDMSTDGGGWTLVTARGSANGIGNTTSTIQNRLSISWASWSAQSVPVDLWMDMVGSTWELLSVSTHSGTKYIHTDFNNWGAQVPWKAGMPCSTMVLDLGTGNYQGSPETNKGFLNNYTSGCTSWSYQYRAYGLAGNGGGHIHGTSSYAFGLYSSENSHNQTHMFSRDGGKMSVYGTGDLGFYIQ